LPLNSAVATCKGNGNGQLTLLLAIARSEESWPILPDLISVVLIKGDPPAETASDSVTENAQRNKGVITPDVADNTGGSAVEPISDIPLAVAERSNKSTEPSTDFPEAVPMLAIQQSWGDTIHHKINRDRS
jgi:hypothetical protein